MTSHLFSLRLSLQPLRAFKVALPVAALSAWAMAAPSLALETIATVGPTEPARPFYQDLHADTPEQQENPAMPGQVEPIGEVPPFSLFPISTPSLSVGPVQQDLSMAQRQALDGLTSPLFVVGTDEQSLQWVSRHREELSRRGAVGLAVEVPDAQAWERLRSVAPGLMISPVSGESVAKELGLTHYPVLVTAQGLQQ